MTLYFETYAGSLSARAILADNDHIISQINIPAKNNIELINALAHYVSQYNVDCIQTNNPVYSAPVIEQKINEVLTNKYSYNKYIRMVCKQ